MENSNMSKFFSKVYLWMFIGLLTSGLTAFFVSSNISLMGIVYSLYYLFIILELIVVIAFSSLRNKVSSNVAKILFLVYSFINGLTLSSIFIVYRLSSVAYIFIAAALMFGLLALYGYKTKQDLSSFGKMMLFALIAIIVMSIINIFVINNTFAVVICIISILVFLGLTAWDMNKLKSIYNYYENDEEELNKVAIYGALDLYLDFINIFLDLLRLFGRAKK